MAEDVEPHKMKEKPRTLSNISIHWHQNSYPAKPHKIQKIMSSPTMNRCIPWCTENPN